jgi:hypothetical protein
MASRSTPASLAIAAVLLGGSVLQAQAKVNIGIGAAIPIGTTADRVNPGYNALLSYSTRMAWMKRNQVRVEVGVNSLPERSVPDVRRQILSGTANLVIVGEPRPGPLGYVILGVGSYGKSGQLVVHRSDPGFNIGAGIRFTMGFFGTFVEARMHYVNDAEKTKYFPMTFGLTF